MIERALAIPTAPTADLPGRGFLVVARTDGRTRIECRFEGETMWLTQALMAELFQTTLQNINLHLQNIYEEGSSTRRQLSSLT